MKELIEEYKKLSLDEKRNEYSNEIISISTIITTALRQFDNDNFHTPNNYLLKKDADLSEEEIIIKNYEDILKIKDNLILLISYYQAKNKN